MMPRSLHSLAMLLLALCLVAPPSVASAAQCTPSAAKKITPLRTAADNALLACGNLARSDPPDSGQVCKACRKAVSRMSSFVAYANSFIASCEAAAPDRSTDDMRAVLRSYETHISELRSIMSGKCQ